MIHDLFKNTHFINLEHRLDRLVHVKKELAKINVVGNRFNAIKLANGAVGCSMSHLKCLELAKQNGSSYVFVCEDDIQFLDPELFLKNLGSFCKTVNAEWDVVQQHYYDTLIANYREGITKLLSDPTNKREYAIDMYWKRLQANDRWYMIVPPTVVQMEGFSDVEGRETNYKHLMTDMNKEWLFKKSMVIDRHSIYEFKPPPQNIQQNSIQQGFNLGIKHRNPFNVVNGKMNLTTINK